MNRATWVCRVLKLTATLGRQCTDNRAFIMLHSLSILLFFSNFVSHLALTVHENPTSIVLDHFESGQGPGLGYKCGAGASSPRMGSECSYCKASEQQYQGLKRHGHCFSLNCRKYMKTNSPCSEIFKPHPPNWQGHNIFISWSQGDRQFHKFLFFLVHQNYYMVHLTDSKNMESRTNMVQVLPVTVGNVGLQVLLPVTSMALAGLNK